jgi:hypothetical protein
MPGVVWRPVPSHSGLMQAHLGLVLHVQVGNSSCYGEFSDPNNQASSTWWIAKDGTIEQYVDSDDAAWTEAAGNFTWDSVETEGEPTESLTDAQVLSLARIYVWGVGIYGWPLQTSDDVNVRGLGWHGMGGLPWGGHFGCPGDLRKAQRAGALFIASLVLHPPAPQPQEAPEMFFTHPVSGLLVGTDADGNIYARDGALAHVVTLPQNPGWKAGSAASGGANPCIGIEAEKDSPAKGSGWGYTFTCKPTSGKGSFGPYNLYHINADGSF